MSDASPGGGDFSGFDGGGWSGSDHGGPSGSDAGDHSDTADQATPPPGGPAATERRAFGGRAFTRRPLLLWAVTGTVLLALVVAGITYALRESVEPGFDSPEAISVLLAQRGAPCADFDDDGGEGKADRRGICYVDGEKIIIATFGSREDVEAHWERQLGVAADNETVGMVIGDTWTISGTARAYLRHAAEVLDAEYRNN